MLHTTAGIIWQLLVLLHFQFYVDLLDNIMPELQPHRFNVT